MKNLAFITLLATCIFSLNLANAVPTHSSDLTNSDLLVGHVSSVYDATTATLTVSIKTTSPEKERVIIQISNSSGDVVHLEKVEVTSRGLDVDISLSGTSSGVYKLFVDGHTVYHSARFKKK